MEDLQKLLKQDRKNLIKKILEIPAVFCADIFQDNFTIRDTEVDWNAIMLTDPGVPFDRLTTIYTLASRKQEFFDKGITP